jgi:hypothetical protein
MKPETATPERPIRVGIFDTVREADEAVSELLAAGFSKEQITVICSEETIRKHFAEYEHQDPAGSKTPAAAIAGGAGGAAIAGLAAIGLASLTALGGVALLAAGGIALWAGGVVGGLVGAMMTRGVEKELANYYDQAVTRGKILVAAEQEDPNRPTMLAKAAEIFAEHGVEPLPMREG